MLTVITGIFLVCPFSFGQHLGDEAIYTINGKKALHSVSEKFLSVSIDPAVLLTGLNLSDVSLQLAKHLGPAYIRIAGPSTRFVRYEDFSGESGGIAVTPTMWFGINEWLTSANLTPVFGINDEETTKGEWNPQSTMPLLDVSDKFNLSCYWQLGYDCSNKTEGQYTGDLKRFKHILEAFPDKKDTWKIVGSDLSKCVSADRVEDTRKILEDLEDVITAIVWEPTTKCETSFLEEHLPDRLLSIPIKPKVPIWTTSPKSSHPTSFSSAISWAKQIGQAAKVGYEVIFRQPRLHEILSETPPFWVSFLHKALMGRTVLDVKVGGTTIGHNSDISVFAHCTRHQNNFIRSGAMTVFMINNSTKNHTIFLRFGTVLLKNIEVQSYVLTAPSEEATDVYLNGDKLNLDHFTEDKMNILPKLRRAKIMNYLSLSLPPKSVGFFVLPGARVPVCINEETDMKLIMNEINEDQKIPFSEEISVEVTPRFVSNKSPTLRELKSLMEKELESDEQYYERMKLKNSQPKKVTFEDFAPRRNIFTERTHQVNKHQRQEFNKKMTKDQKLDPPKKIFELELTSGELRRVLADRAKVKAAKKNIIFTSEELEEIMHKATEKFLKDKNTSIRIRKKAKREAERNKKDINMRLLKLKTLGEKRRLMLKQMGHHRPKTQEKREKRDINMDLLKLKTDVFHNKNKKPSRSKFINHEEKEATIREAGQTSDELMEDYVEEKEETGLPNEDVFAELADPNDFIITTTEKSRIIWTKKPLLNIRKPLIPKFDFKSKKLDAYKLKPKPIASEFEDFEDSFDAEADPNGNFACIHEFSGGNLDKGEDKKEIELWEVGMESMERKGNHLPTFQNRAFSFEEDKESKSNSGCLNCKDLEDDMSGENDYGDLESDEKNPVRFRRNTNEMTDTLKEQQIKILKTRMAIRKKLDLFNRTRKIRSVDEKDNSFNKRYKSLTENLQIWKPSDILNLKNNNVKRLKRSADNYVNSVENGIDDFMNEIVKESKMIEPKLDRENGDYQLVFPNQDKIEVVENHGDTELKLLIHGNEGETCPTTTEATTESNIQKISKKFNGNIWEKMFRKMKKLFHSLSRKLKKYVLDDLFKE